MKYQYTTVEYIAAIDREQLKRSTTYPKIILKLKKGGAELIELIKRQREMNDATEKLAGALNILNGNPHYSESLRKFVLEELIREYKMRRKCYGRWVLFKRMTHETAEYEKWLWRELCIYFAETYLGDPQIALNAIETKPRRSKQINSEQ